MNDKDRDFCNKTFLTFRFKNRCAPEIPYTYGFRVALEYAHKENKELLEKCNSVLGMVHHINDVNDESVIEITANAKELILELNTAGIGKE